VKMNTKAMMPAMINFKYFFISLTPALPERRERIATGICF